MKWHGTLIVVVLIGTAIILGRFLPLAPKEQSGGIDGSLDDRLNIPIPQRLQSDASLRAELLILEKQLSEAKQRQSDFERHARIALAERAMELSPKPNGTGEEAAWADRSATDQTDHPAQEAEQREHIERIVSSLDESLLSESYDTRWATQIEADIANTFTTGDWKGNNLLDTDCRASLCRLTVTHVSPEVSGAFAARVGLLPAFGNAQGFYQSVTLEDGSPGTIVYIARQGDSLPEISPP